jgi:hypothetical protein
MHMSIYIKLVQFQKPSGRKGNGFVPTKSRDIQCPMPHCGPRPLHRTRTALYLRSWRQRVGEGLLPLPLGVCAYPTKRESKDLVFKQQLIRQNKG